MNIYLPGVDGKKRFWNFRSNDFCWFCFTCRLNKSRMCSMICIGKLWSDGIMKSCWININIKCQVLVFFRANIGLCTHVWFSFTYAASISMNTFMLELDPSFVVDKENRMSLNRIKSRKKKNYSIGFLWKVQIYGRKFKCSFMTQIFK